MTRPLPPFETELQRLVVGLADQLPSCINCEHGTSMRADVPKNPHCALAPDAGVPPPRIIARGCPAFSGDIPF